MNERFIQHLHEQDSKETLLNDWDREYLQKGAEGVLKKMLTDFNGKAPDLILLPDTGARPLYYLFAPIFRKLNEARGIKPPHFAFFNIASIPDDLQAFAERRIDPTAEIKTKDELLAVIDDYIKQNPDSPMSQADIDAVEPSLHVEQTAQARGKMGERAAEIKHLLAKYPETQMVILDDFFVNQAALDEIKRAMGTRQIRSYALSKTPLSRERNDGDFEATAGHHLSDNDPTNPAWADRFRFSFSRTAAIGVRKNKEGAYATPLNPDDPELNKMLARQKTRLRQEMRELGEHIASSIT